MTKADLIRNLWADGRSKRQIADEVGCDIQYVRVVLHQRTDERGCCKPAKGDVSYAVRVNGAPYVRRYKQSGASHA